MKCVIVADSSLSLLKFSRGMCCFIGSSLKPLDVA
jgi:hypothetical protein